MNKPMMPSDGLDHGLLADVVKNAMQTIQNENQLLANRFYIERLEAEITELKRRITDCKKAGI